MGIDLPLLWALIIGFGLMMYVIMDGFDLGIGILFPFVSTREDRDTMVNTVAPVWDGNVVGVRRRGAACGLSAGLFGHPERALFATHLNAGRPHLARRRLRISFQGRRGA